MKIKLYTILFLLTIVTTAYSQMHICGTSHEDQAGMLEFIDNFNKTAHTTTRSVDPIYAPVKFHMVSNNDGTGRVKANSVLSQMARLIEDYKEFGIYLYIDMDNDGPESSFDYLNNTSIYNNPGVFGNSIVGEKDGDAVNIFITENANTGSDVGIVLGYYSPNGDYVVIRNEDVNSVTSTLTHELGHFFSLPHPFVGWENIYNHYNWTITNPDGSKSPTEWDVTQFNGMFTSNFVPGTALVAEVVDQSNCTTTADRICDTPPDYNFGLGAGGCFWDNSLKDKNGDVIDPIEINVMSYFGNCSEYAFTEGQVAVMKVNIESDDRDHLKSGYTPDTTTIESNHELLFPSSGEELEYYDKILLDWSDADGASHYLVTINSSGYFEEFYVSESELYLPELNPDIFYFWEVRPFNEAYTDTEGKSDFFTTGSDLNTSVTESELIQSVNVYPNPGNLGQDIHIAISMEKTTNVTVSLIDITGKTIFSENQKLNQGNNSLRVEAMTQAGIYILKLDTEDGSIHKKVIIN